MSKLDVVLKTTLSTFLEEARYVHQKIVCYDFLHFIKVQVFLRYQKVKEPQFQTNLITVTPFYTMEAQLNQLYTFNALMCSCNPMSDYN